ncbi:MAG TPA: helix-hairpin-helix domain-containing protein [Daejeonella sp.]|nr:helix-hairpin-helix domain-containing protein [Daejeonella sp.]
MKNFLKAYFSFSKKEFNGILVLCTLISLALMAPSVYRLIQKPEIYKFENFSREIEKFKSSASRKPSNFQYKNIKDEIEDSELKMSKSELFVFDPNNLPESEWLRLGLSARQIKGIKNYEAKGGRFYKKEDLQKMYSIPAWQFAQLKPYIDIKSFKNEDYPANRQFHKEENPSKKLLPVVELNSADSVQLQSLRGIGPAFASRIVRYRNRLGGFYSMEQLLEVYGLDSARYEGLINQIRVDVANLRKININQAAFEEIKTHPYLTYKQVNAIIQYRKQHGVYNSIEDLKKIAILNEQILRKIGPYLIFE